MMQNHNALLSLKRKIHLRFDKFRKEYTVPHSLIVDDFEYDVLNSLDEVTNQIQEIFQKEVSKSEPTKTMAESVEVAYLQDLEQKVLAVLEG